MQWGKVKHKEENIFFNGMIKLFLIVMPSLIVSAYLGFNIPKILKNLSNVFSDHELFKKELLFLTLVFIFTYLNRVIYQLIINKSVKDLVHNIRQKCFSKWIHAYEVEGELTSKKHYPQGEVITRILNDTEAIRELITSGTFGIFIDAFFVISCLISFIKINSTLGFSLTIIEVICVALLIIASKVMRKVFLEVGHSRGRMARAMANLVGGVRETFYTTHFNYATKKGKLVFDNFLNIQLKANMWDAIYYSIAESLYPILLALMVLVFPYTKITEAAIIFVIVDLIQRSIAPIKDIAGKISNVQRAMAGVIRIREFTTDLNLAPSSLLLEKDQQESLTDFKLDSLEVSVDLFSYPERKDSSHFSLKNIHFKAYPGQFFGIVGMSGCGKSTLFNIIAGKIYPDEGKICVNTKNNKPRFFPSENPIELRNYREMIGLVGQDSHIFSDTLEFNLSLGIKNPFQSLALFFEDLQKEIPYIESWGISLEDNIDPSLLSLGQKQLLAAIRALYWHRPVILFDEISSALDSDLEIALRKVIAVIQKSSLVFIVAHRVETIINADCILALKDGELVAKGRHHELLEKNEYYQNFMKELMHSPQS